jgi:hypothetical protein
VTCHQAPSAAGSKNALNTRSDGAAIVDVKSRLGDEDTWLLVHLVIGSSGYWFIWFIGYLIGTACALQFGPRYFWQVPGNRPRESAPRPVSRGDDNQEINKPNNQITR